MGLLSWLVGLGSMVEVLDPLSRASVSTVFEPCFESDFFR